MDILYILYVGMLILQGLILITYQFITITYPQYILVIVNIAIFIGELFYLVCIFPDKPYLIDITTNK